MAPPKRAAFSEFRLGALAKRIANDRRLDSRVVFFFPIGVCGIAAASDWRPLRVVQDVKHALYVDASSTQLNGLKMMGCSS